MESYVDDEVPGIWCFPGLSCVRHLSPKNPNSCKRAGSLSESGFRGFQERPRPLTATKLVHISIHINKHDASLPPLSPIPPPAPHQSRHLYCDIRLRLPLPSPSWRHCRTSCRTPPKRHSSNHCQQRSHRHGETIDASQGANEYELVRGSIE